MTRRRAGRKRKVLAEREPSGRVSRAGQPKADKGTAELQAKRAVLAAGADPAATTRWLDVLTAWGLLSPRQQQAGADYARLRAKVFGTVSGGLKAARLDPEEARGPVPIDQQDGPSEAHLAAAKRRYDRATRRLRAVSRQMEAEIKELVLYDRPPLIASVYAGRVTGQGAAAKSASTFAKPPSPAALKQWAWLAVGLEILESALAEESASRQRPRTPGADQVA